jgi:two-component system OmpR family sensor kinase
MHLSNWTLRRRLILLTTALVAATSIVIGAVVSLVVWNTLSAQFNDQVHSAVRNAGLLDNDAQSTRGFLDDGDVIVAVYAPDLGLAEGKHQDSSGTSALSSAAFREIRADVPRTNGGPNGALTTVSVPGYGEYRFAVATPQNSNDVVYVGRPTSILTNGLFKYLGPILLVVVLAIVLAGIIGAFVIGRALRPLRRVSLVASNVASLPLERGDVELPERVPEEETNPNTEVGQVGAALNNLLDSVASALAVRQASEEKVRHFVADASHELRTPLASIRGYAELTRRFGGDLTEDVQHNIGRIESEAKRMTSLVEDLLLLARLDAERELDTVDVDLSRLLVDVVSDAHAAGRDHEWDFELPEEPVIVRGDEAKLQQVFTNLLANARVHTPAGTHVVVELGQPVDDHVLVRVRDDGPGIPEELRPQLFGRFVRGDSSRNRNTGSTGLGLSIVNAVVEAHHGTVSVASEPGATVFTVQLPVHQPAAKEAPREPVPA